MNNCCKLNVGDKVRGLLIRDDTYTETTITRINHRAVACGIWGYWKDDGKDCDSSEQELDNYKDNQIKLISNKTMKTVKNLFKKLVDKDTQTLYKANFLNGDLELTEEGKTALLEVLFLEKKADLVKIAEEKITEEEKNK